MTKPTTTGRKAVDADAPRVKTSLSLPAGLWRTTRMVALESGVDAQDIVEAALLAYFGRAPQSDKKTREIAERLRSSERDYDYLVKRSTR